MSSITTKLDKQLEEFTAEVRADPLLKGGFSAVGLSQGNLVLRAYIERVNDPPVHQFISVCGPNNGVGTCPDNLAFKSVCPLWRLAKYSAPISFADYWKDAANEQQYLDKSRFLADLNNERQTKNATYARNMRGLKKLVLVEALNDTMVIPHESESFGFWQWGQSAHGRHKLVVPMRETEGYKGDWIGLKSLDTSGRLKHHVYVGDHLRFSNDFWEKTVLPYLGE